MQVCFILATKKNWSTGKIAENLQGENQKNQHLTEHFNLVTLSLFFKSDFRWPKLLAALSYAEKLIECFDFEEENWFVLTEKPG